MELNQNGQIEVDEVASPAVLLSTSHSDGGASVISIHEQTNGDLTNNNNHLDTTINSNGGTAIANGDLTDAAKQLNGLNDSIDTDAVGFFTTSPSS